MANNSIDWQLYRANRQRSADDIRAELLPILEQAGPGCRAEQVGAWLWLWFPDKPGANIRAAVKQLGFKWNKDRACWQHPGGVLNTGKNPGDPRYKYGSHTFYGAQDEN